MFKLPAWIVDLHVLFFHCETETTKTFYEDCVVSHYHCKTCKRQMYRDSPMPWVGYPPRIEEDKARLRAEGRILPALNQAISPKNT